jgi:hypothetical protein
VFRLRLGGRRVPLPDVSYPVTNPVVGVTKWDFKCVDHETAGVRQHWANHDLNEPDGWNPFLAKMAGNGWEPVTFIAHPTGAAFSPPSAAVVAVCFRKPATPAAAGTFKSPPQAPAGPLGRCSGAQIAEMRGNGMSESAINAA